MVALSNELLQNCGADEFNTGHIPGPEFKGHTLEEYEEALRQEGFNVTRSSLLDVNVLYFQMEKRNVPARTKGPDESRNRAAKVTHQRVQPVARGRSKENQKRHVR